MQRRRIETVRKAAFAAVVTAAVWVWIGPVVAVISVAVGILVGLLVYRKKAPSVPGAVYSAAADVIAPGSPKRRPGQLSLTASGISWLPSTYSERQGVGRIDFDFTKVVVALQNGPALLDLTLVISMPTGQVYQLCIHRSAALRRTLRTITDRHGGGTA